MFLTSILTLPSRFSNVAGVPEIQELKRAAELRSKLRTVSEAGVGAGLSGVEWGAGRLPIGASS